jgi:DNA-binding transcriptional ArsR family regulator
MLKQSPSLDLVFQALADPTRRAMVERMTHGPASVSDLARPFAMTLAAVMQHLKVLEESGLVRTHKEGRVRTCTIEPTVLRTAEDWIADRRTSWETKLDRLGALLEEN